MPEYERTTCPDTVIVARTTSADGQPVVHYWNQRSDEHYEVTGTCIACGACEVGNADPWLAWRGPVGTPGACVDVRREQGLPVLDSPMRPELCAELAPPCTLTGQYVTPPPAPAE
jgi:hypothetical protein